MLILFVKFTLFVGISVAGLLVVRKYFNHTIMEVHNEVAGFIYAVLGVIYAVLLAFIVIAVWEDYIDAEKNVHKEVSHVVDIYRNAEAFSDSLKIEIQTACTNYINDVVQYEWEAMKNLKISEEAKRSYLYIWAVHQKYVPVTEYESLWYAESIGELNKLADARRFRIFSIYYDIAPIMWVVLFTGAFIIIGFSYLFGTKNKTAHLIMVFSLSATICLILILIDALEHPFSDFVHLTPESFIMTLDQLK
jgi:hypothetical protein